MLLTRAWFWLVFQAALLLVLLWRCDRFRLYPIDADWYVGVATGTDWLSPRDVLSHYRTCGYPLFLRAVLLISPTLSGLPLCHLAVRLLAVFAFYAGLRQIQATSWLALAMASVLLYSNVVIFAHEDRLLISEVLTDSLGESLTILSVAMLLMVVSRPNSPLRWLGLGLSLFLTYQTRPAAQFLVVLLPVLGLPLLRLVSAPVEWAQRWRRFALISISVCLLPFLAWCALRLAVVGHFGLVSFTGHAMIGIAGQFLTEDMVSGFPEDVQPFVLAVLKKREALIQGQEQTLFGVPWRSPLESDGRLRPDAVQDEAMFVVTQSQLFEFTASEMFEPDNVVQDRKLLEAALAILKARPRYYFMWVAQSTPLTLGRIVTTNLVFFWLLWILVPLLGIWLLLVGVPSVTRQFRLRDAGHDTGAGFALELKVIWLLALGVALGNAAVIILMGQPLLRYTATSGVLLPAAAVATQPHMVEAAGGTAGGRESR